MTALLQLVKRGFVVLFSHGCPIAAGQACFCCSVQSRLPYCSWSNVVVLFCPVMAALFLSPDAGRGCGLGS